MTDHPDHPEPIDPPAVTDPEVLAALRENVPLMQRGPVEVPFSINGAPQ